jgi:integrase
MVRLGDQGLPETARGPMLRSSLPGLHLRHRAPLRPLARPAISRPLPQQEHIQVTPHVLRHTFLRKPAEAEGVHDVRDASSHQRDRYSWRDVKPDRQSLAEAGRVLIQLIV